MFRTVRISAAVALATIALAGCSLLAPTTTGSSADPTSTTAAKSQTARDACLAIKPSLESLTTEMTGAFDAIKDDPTSAVPLLQKVSGEFRDAIAELDNKQVVDVTTTAADSLDAMTVEVQNVLAGTGDQSALLAAATKVQTDFNAIDTVCRAAVDG